MHKKAKRQWIVVIGVALMLLAMVVYVLSMDEEVQPTEGSGTPPGAVDQGDR
ncbi:MAG: hypothetical protein JXQ73_26955 [Phycisphaerae bacterium]|nr:hypothetical protein [Phycisphaerae bacterium]